MVNKIVLNQKASCPQGCPETIKIARAANIEEKNDIFKLYQIKLKIFIIFYPFFERIICSIAIEIKSLSIIIKEPSPIERITISLFGSTFKNPTR
jgi:hypothetical protein